MKITLYPNISLHTSKSLLLYVYFIALFTSAAPWANAEPCFLDVYYKMLFKPLKLEVISADDSRLSAYSDYVTSKGKDPHSKTDEGCMCGVNNGRWDQLLTNTSPGDTKQVPVWFRLKQITIDPYDKMNKPNGKTIRIDADKLRSCYQKPTTVPGHRPFNMAGGKSNRPDVLEPGESIISCTCLLPGDRRKSGYAKVSVSYEPTIWAANVVKAVSIDKINPNSTRWKARFTLSNFGKGEGKYFILQIPKDGGSEWSDIRVSLKNFVDIVLFARTSAQGWSWNQNEWEKGDLKVADSRSGIIYWILVRSLSEKGFGVLEIQYVTRSNQLQSLSKESGAHKDAPITYEEVKIGEQGACTFKAYLLGLGMPKIKQAEAVIFKDKCCSGDSVK
jgi:hypothetical protein